MGNKEKIGIGIVTYNRVDYLKQCIKSLEDNNLGGADDIIIVDDCSSDGTKEFMSTLSYTTYYKNTNKGIANSKNVVLKNFIGKNFEHIFIIEDDILVKDPLVLKKYILYAKVAGIKHLNFGLHGELNKGKRFTYCGISCFPDCVGAFSYYHKDVIDKVGYLDENFINAWEHVEHTWRIAEAGLTTPFWKFADHPTSEDLLEEIQGSINNSSIRIRKDWQDNIDKGRKYWIKKHGKGLPPRPK